MLYKFTKSLYGHQIYVQNNALKSLLIGSILRFEDDFMKDLLNHPEKKYVDNLKSHPFWVELERARHANGKFVFKQILSEKFYLSI